MEKLNRRELALLNMGVVTFILSSACSDNESPMEAESCKHLPIEVAPSTDSNIDMPVIVPAEGDPWRTGYGVSLTGNTVQVIQIDASTGVDIYNPIATKTFDLQDASGVDFTDPQSETVVRVTPDPDREATPKVAFDMAFCQPET